MIRGHPIREWAELLGPMLDIPSKYSNQPWKILFNRFHILEKILDCVSLPSYGGWCGWWKESNEYSNVGNQNKHEQHHLSSVMSIVLKYPVSQTKNLDEEKSCIEGMSGCLLEEVNVYEQSVNHWSQLGSIHLQRFQDLNISSVKSSFCYPGVFPTRRPGLRRGQSWERELPSRASPPDSLSTAWCPHLSCAHADAALHFLRADMFTKHSRMEFDASIELIRQGFVQSAFGNLERILKLVLPTGINTSGL